jgi:hypothetical protein
MKYQIIIFILSITLISCSKEEIKPEVIKYKHPVAPDRIQKDTGIEKKIV